MKYFGIADAHGIESFIKGDPNEEAHSRQAMILAQKRAGDLSRIQIWILITRRNLSAAAWVNHPGFFVG